MSFKLILAVLALVQLFTFSEQTEEAVDVITRLDISNIPPSVFADDVGVLKTKTLSSFNPEVGNGHLATVIKGDTIFMNGLYNGEDYSSHRARVPSRAEYNVMSIIPQGLSKTYSLDLGRGMFIESYEGQGVSVSLRTYAHRTLTRTLVVELDLVRDNAATDVEVTLDLDNARESDDIYAVDELKVGGVNHWRTYMAEYKELKPKIDFYTKLSPLMKGVIKMKTGQLRQSFLAITVIGYDKDKVVNEYDDAFKLFIEGSLLSSHVAEWTMAWNKGRIDVKGNVDIARLNHATMYYLFSSLPFQQPEASRPFFGLSPNGLAHGESGEDYWGHVFWDQDIWMFPPIAFLHSDIGRTLVGTRSRTLESAKLLAKKTGYEGARYPWEQAYTGLEVCPGRAYANYEIHVNGDVSMMLKQYWQLTHDLDFFTKGSGAEIVQELAKFWVSRTTYEKSDKTYRLNGVMPPDEWYFPVNNSAYTNSIATINLKFANQINDILKRPRNQTWETVANQMYLPYDSQLDYHPEFDGYSHDEWTKQADVVLLNFPMMVDMKHSTMKNDLIMYEKSTPKENVPAMTWGIFLIGWLQLGEEEKAEDLFYRSIKNAKSPFLVWAELADGGGAVNFATGMGAYLQSLIFGYGGCRIYDDRLTFNPRLLPNTTQTSFIGIDYRGFSFDLIVDEDYVAITMTNRPNLVDSLQVTFQQDGLWETFALNKPAREKRQPFEIRVSKLEY